MKTFRELSEAKIVQDIKGVVSKTRMENHLKKNTRANYKIIMNPLNDEGFIILVKDDKDKKEIDKVLDIWGYNPDNQKEPISVETEKSIKGWTNESSENRYIVNIEMYMYDKDDKSVMKQADKLVKDLQKKDDNQAEVISIIEQNFASSDSRKVK